MKTVLVALDFSEFYHDVERVGYQIAEAISASVTLITIINKSLNYTAAYTGLIFTDQWEERLYIANKKLDEVKNRHPHIETHIISFIGHPKQDIIEAAFHPDVSFVVMGKFGRTGITSLIMGGTAAHIIGHCTKPVIVVPFKKSRH